MTTADQADHLMTTLLREPGRPRLTWYGGAGERIELSGAVLVNWVAKTAALAADELGLTEGDRVRLDLPAHWRTVVWVLALWRAGVTVDLTDGHLVDAVVTDRPAPGSAPTVAVALGPLARRFPGDLPAGSVDYAAAVLGYPDLPAPAATAPVATPALVGPGGTTTFAQLAPGGAGSSGRRTLLVIAEGRASTTFVLTTHDRLAENGSLVVVHPAAAGRLADLAHQERVDETVGAQEAL